MAQVVYVNHPNNKAIVHSESCYKYRKRRREKTRNGYWKGKFSDLDEASAFAYSTQKKQTDGSGPNSLDSLREMLSSESGKRHVRPQAALASG